MTAGEKQVMIGADIDRSLRRIAHEIVEHHQGTADIVLVGIHTRGVPLATRLGGFLGSLGDLPIASGVLDIGMYRDDLGLRPTPELGTTAVPGGIDGKHVVLVDDVLFTGRTIRAALDALSDLGRPSSV